MSLIKKSFIVLFLFLFIFSPPVKALVISPSKLIPILLLILMLILDIKIVLPNYKRIFGIAILWILYSFLRGYLSGDYSFITQNTFFLLEYFFGSVIMVTFLTKYFDFINLIRFFFYSLLFQGFIIVTMVISSGFYSFIISLYRDDFKFYAIELYERYLGFRGYGFSSSITYDLGVLLSLGIIVGYFLNKKDIITKRVYKISFVLLLISSLLVARSSIVVIAIFFIYINYRKVFKFKFLFISLILTVSLVVFKEELFVFLQSNGYTQFIFEMLINYELNGELSSASTDGLAKMYKIDYANAIFGTGNFTTPEEGYFGHTDVGYLRHLLYGGIPSLLLLFAWYYQIIIKIPRVNFNNLILLISLILIVIQFKGDILFGSGQIARFNFILILLLYASKRKNYSC